MTGRQAPPVMMANILEEDENVREAGGWWVPHDGLDYGEPVVAEQLWLGNARREGLVVQYRASESAGEPSASSLDCHGIDLSYTHTHIGWGQVLLSEKSKT